jgi:DNA-binding transcriptional MerR regulator/uncharacterized glyoxalase superfamily protein PhnB
MTRSEPDATMRKIGDIAAATGMTVRTLRYYEEIGLLEPSSRTDAGHRLYGPAAVERLYRIAQLRSLGLPLDGVRAGLDDEGAELRALMTDHLAAVDARMEAERRLRGRLLRLVGTLESNEDTTGDLLNVLEDMTMLETTLNRRIAILVYDDIEAAFEYLIRVYAFGPGELMRDPDGAAVHAEIQAGDGEFWLHVESEPLGLATPNHLGGASGTMAIMVGDVDAHHRYAVEQGATIRFAPIDQDYGYREYGAVDLGGHLWSFMKPLD